jgi:hypothetical protein
VMRPSQEIRIRGWQKTVVLESFQVNLSLFRKGECETWMAVDADVARIDPEEPGTPTIVRSGSRDGWALERLMLT